MSWTKSAIVGSEILKLFVHILTTDYKSSRRNMLNFTQQLEEAFSQKQRTFSGSFIAFLKCALNLEHLDRKDEYLSLVISRIFDSERDGYLNV